MRIVGQGKAVAKRSSPCFSPGWEFEYKGSIYVPGMPYPTSCVSYETLLRWMAEGRVKLIEETTYGYHACGGR